MKNESRGLINTMLLIIFSLSCGNMLFAQEKVNISGGFGFPEVLNLGLRFQHNQTQLGISLGSLPSEDEKLVTVSADFYYHFGGFSDLSERRPWYSRAGLSYSRDEMPTFIDKLLYMNLRIGRDFNVSKKIGFELDAGLGIRILSDITSGWDFPVMPSFGINLFYRL